MGIAFYFPTKASPTASWVPSRQPVYPAVEPTDYPLQLTAESAGGTLYVQDKGTKRETFTLRFNRIPKTDRDNYLTFFNTVKKTLNTFEFEDRNAVLHTVRIMNEFDFEEAVAGRFSGTIDLRKE